MRLREWDFKREHLANLTFPRSELQNWENPMEKRLVKLCAIKMKYKKKYTHTQENEIHSVYHQRNQNNNKYSMKRRLCHSDIRSLYTKWQIL